MNKKMLKVKALIKALKIILSFKGLDLTINTNTAHYGLRFYTLFNRLEAANNVLPILRNDLLYMNANIITPNSYTPRFNNMNREVILPLAEIEAVAFVIKGNYVNMFLRELRRFYHTSMKKDFYDYCGDKLQNIDFECFSHMNNIYEIFVDAIDRSNNPLRGRIVAYDSQVLWIQASDTDTPPTFYLVPIEAISFIALGTK